MKNNKFLKKTIIGVGVSVMVLGSLIGCGKKNDQVKNQLTVAASPVPHSEILAYAKELLEEKGIDLKVVEYTDYVQPNKVVNEGDIDANYFQHLPHLDDFNANNKAKLVAAGFIHFEPLGIYPGKSNDLKNIKDGAKIAVPNDTSNEARALLLLQEHGLIKLKEEAGFNATTMDIVENPHNIEIVELEAVQVSRVIDEMDFAVINGNYALLAGLNVEKDSLVREEKGSDSAETYTNIVAVREGDEKREDIKALIEVLSSDKMKAFIDEKYQGSVVINSK